MRSHGAAGWRMARELTGWVAGRERSAAADRREKLIQPSLSPPPPRCASPRTPPRPHRRPPPCSFGHASCYTPHASRHAPRATRHTPSCPAWHANKGASICIPILITIITTSQTEGCGGNTPFATRPHRPRSALSPPSVDAGDGGPPRRCRQRASKHAYLYNMRISVPDRRSAAQAQMPPVAVAATAARASPAPVPQC